MSRTRPPFRADHVGSLLRSAALRDARAKRERGEIDAAALTDIEDREIKALIARQEEIGLKSITDGEYRRASWQTDFLRALPGIETFLGDRKLKFQSAVQPPQWVSRVKEKLGAFTDHPQIAHWRFVADNTRATAKVTIPSPSALHFRQGRAAVPEAIYPDMEDFYRDLGALYAKVVRAFADAGCRYLQLDEVNLAYLCDPSLREHVKARGDDPDTLPLTYARHDQRCHLGHPVRHDDHDAPVPREFPLQFRGERRLRAGGRDPVQHHQGARLFHGVRQRARGRLRAAALPAEGQDRRARAGHVQDRAA